MNSTHSSNPYKKNRGFTMIELLVVIAIIGILATTLIPKLRKELAKAKVAKVQHKLGLIRSKLSIDSNFSDEFPDLVNASTNLNINFLDQFDVHPTEAFSSKKGSFGETDQIVGSRTNEGGWFYNRTKGEIYANLPNGAYTYDKIYEIWKGEGSVTLEDLQNLEDVGDVKAMKVDDNGYYINNPSFENIIDGSYGQVNKDDIEYWGTTDSKNKIEIWGNGFQSVNSPDGKHFIELNANSKGSLYQDIVTIPGTTLIWSVSHRGREGIDEATLAVGTPDTKTENLEELANMETGNKNWNTYSSNNPEYTEYVVPEGQTVTRFYINSGKTAGNNSTVGNLIDNFTVKVKLDDE